jgi:hypothetical protein
VFDADGKTPATSAEPAGAPSLLAAPAPASSQQKPSKAAGAQPEIRVEDLTLPPGIAVAEGKGLLEVDTGGRHAIYVGGAFVGRGPIRRVELDPGSHQVRVRLDAEQLEHTVTILKGRRARLALSKGP